MKYSLVIDAKWVQDEGSERASWSFVGSLEDISEIISRFTNDVAERDSITSLGVSLEGMGMESVPVCTCFFCN